MLRHNLSEMRVSVRGGVYILQKTSGTVYNSISVDDVTAAFYDAYEEAGERLKDISAQEGWILPVYLRRVDEEAIMDLSKTYGLNFRLEVD